MTKSLIPISLGVLIKIVLNLLIYMLLSRALEVERFGFFAMVFGSIFMFNNFMDFGLRLRVLADSDVIQANIKGFILIWLKIKAFLCLLFLISVYVFSLLMNYSALDTWLLIVAVINGFLLSCSYIQAYVFILKENFKVELIVNTFLLVGAIFGFVLFLKSNSELVLMLMITLMLTMSLIYSIAKLRKIFFTAQVSGAEFNIKQELLKTFPFALHLMFTMFIGFLDVFIMEVLLVRAELSSYQVLTRIIVGLTLGVMVASIYIPAMIKKLSKVKGEKLAGFVKLSQTVLVLLAICFVSVYYLLDKAIITLLFGEAYADLSYISGALALIVILKYSQIVPGSIISILGAQQDRVKALAIAFFVMLLGFIIFVPEYRITGAVVVLTVTNLLVFLLYLFFSRKTLMERKKVFES